jgi:hypothetical protein
LGVVENSPPPYIEIRQDTPRGLYLIYMYYVVLVKNIYVALWGIPTNWTPHANQRGGTPYALGMSFAKGLCKNVFNRIDYLIAFSFLCN